MIAFPLLRSFHNWNHMPVTQVLVPFLLVTGGEKYFYILLVLIFLCVSFSLLCTMRICTKFYASETGDNNICISPSVCSTKKISMGAHNEENNCFTYSLQQQETISYLRQSFSAQTTLLWNCCCSLLHLTITSYSNFRV